jgi:tetratricopeptide (TPR) repeat protein
VIHRHSGGNALFIAAIVQDMVKQGLIQEDQGNWTLTAPPDEINPRIPDTLHQMLAIQIEKLTPEEQQILQSGSVGGERFSVWAVTAMLDIAPSLVEDICDKLAERQQIIRFAGIQIAPNGADSAHYEFRHSLYRQALYGQLSDVRRSKLHRKMGQQLLPICAGGKRELAAELALHLEKGRDNEQAVRYSLVNAENALGRFAHRDSIQILDHALALASQLETGRRSELEIEILQRIGDAQYALGAISDSAAAFEEAANCAPHAGLEKTQVEALARLAVPAWYLDPERGARICHQALEVVERLGDRLLLAQTQLAGACFRLVYEAWRKEDAAVCASAADTICGLTGSTPLANMFYAYVLVLEGDYRRALELTEFGKTGGIGPAADVPALGVRTLALIASGRFGEALQIIRAARERMERNGEDPWVFIFREAWLRMLCFDFEKVQDLSRIIMRSDAQKHAAQPRTIALMAAGNAELERGKYDLAGKYFAEIQDYTVSSHFFLHWHWRVRAQFGSSEARLNAGDLVNARREADALLAAALATADPNLQAPAWEMKARVAMAEGDDRGALEYLANALGITDQFDIPVEAWRVHAAAWQVYSTLGDLEKANKHRARAKELILGIADSFGPGEPLRHSFLSAAPLQRIIGRARGHETSRF